jgi:arsenical pump membrane protein
MLLILALVLLAVVLGFAVVRPRGWPETFAAVPAVVVLVFAGAISVHDATAEMTRLLHAVFFLGAVLVLAKLCDDEGLFTAAGAAIARASASGGPTRQLLRNMFVVTSVLTAALGLDATIVLFTPAVLATVRWLRAPERPHAYATVQLTHTASLLLPVSNLTNLLAFQNAGISFTKFMLVMTLPWLASSTTLYLVFRWFFAGDLRGKLDQQGFGDPPRLPRFVVVVVTLTLVGFAVAQTLGVAPAWAAFAGASVLAAHGFSKRRSSLAGIVRSVNVSFLIFVLALGVVVKAVMLNGMTTVMSKVVPAGSGLLALLGIAALAAVLANIVNNVPATLVLLPLVADGGPAAVLAVLIGVDIGPNLSYVGSLSNLLWRKVVGRHQIPNSVGEYTRLGLCSMPTALVAAVIALWASLRLIAL